MSSFYKALTTFRTLDLQNAAQQIKAAAGSIHGLWVTNKASSVRYIKLYDAAAATVGTTTPLITLGIPGNSSDNVAGLFASEHGIGFATGICIAATTGLADTDVGAPGTNDLIVNVFFR